MAAVSFVERSNEANYILVMNDEDENSSFVGMLGGVQALKISNWTRRLILHEIGHALGLSHEHQRSDRDDFVDVIWENIRSEKKVHSEFETRSISVPTISSPSCTIEETLSLQTVKIL